MTTINALDVIVAKRDGHRLTDDQIDWFVSTYAAGTEIADEQASALAMAIFLNGMEPDELAHWTAAMIASGVRLDLSGVGRPTVDKHSTGGVGDKISLILVPLVAACGAAVPQLSGRGLGHTGGTLDKMESITGWRAQLGLDEMRSLLGSIGGVIAGASADLAPADRKLYALRDVTGTVESIPLIASSIMSKKIAEGTDALVLDVKTGAGAFMSDLDRAIELAETMVALGEAHGVATRALVTGMDDVLGRAVGNALEVQESLDVLTGGGPDDVVELTVALAEEMCALAGVDADPRSLLASGAALDTFHAMVAAQDGDLDAGLPVADHIRVLDAPRAGVVHRVDARGIGVAAWRLGAGRARKEDLVSPTAGIVCLAKPGEAVEAGQPVFELHADDPARIDGVLTMVRDALVVADEPYVVPDIVIRRIG
jgi:thymidine phosphorylase